MRMILKRHWTHRPRLNVIWDPRSRIQDPGSRIPDPGSWIQDSGSMIKDPGYLPKAREYPTPEIRTLLTGLPDPKVHVRIRLPDPKCTPGPLLYGSTRPQSAHPYGITRPGRSVCLYTITRPQMHTFTGVPDPKCTLSGSRILNPGFCIQDQGSWIPSLAFYPPPLRFTPLPSFNDEAHNFQFSFPKIAKPRISRIFEKRDAKIRGAGRVSGLGFRV